MGFNGGDSNPLALAGERILEPSMLAVVMDDHSIGLPLEVEL